MPMAGGTWTKMSITDSFLIHVLMRNDLPHEVGYAENTASGTTLVEMGVIAHRLLGFSTHEEATRL